mgnify:CR=1 FL=1
MTAMLLADHGAQVTKIERPGGDPFRAQLGYQCLAARQEAAPRCDLKDRQDLKSFLALAAHADVLVESFSPGCDGPARHRLRHVEYGEPATRVTAPLLATAAATATPAGPVTMHWWPHAPDCNGSSAAGPEGAINHMSGVEDPFAEVEIPLRVAAGRATPGPALSNLLLAELGARLRRPRPSARRCSAREITGRGSVGGDVPAAGGIRLRQRRVAARQKIDAPMFNSWILGSRSPKGHFECADGRWIHNWVPNPRFLLTASRG